MLRPDTSPDIPPGASVDPWRVDWQEMASGLRFPEGPVALADGSVLIVEIARGTLSRVSASGEISVVAELGGGPNGAAIGPDGRCYVCNNGGFEWHEVGGRLIPGHQSSDYRSGSIQAVDLATGCFETLYTDCGGKPLRGPNDLVFDRDGGFWFTDHGKTRLRDRDTTGVFYARADGSSITESVFPLDAPNGIAMSPQGDRIYVAETRTARVWYWNLSAPGVIDPHPRSPHGGYLLAGLSGLQMLDSMAVDGDGRVCVATLIRGGITIIEPPEERGDAAQRERRAVHVATDDPLTTNICFGGSDLSTAFVTLSSSGRLVRSRWPTAGLRLAHQALRDEAL